MSLKKLFTTSILPTYLLLVTTSVSISLLCYAYLERSSASSVMYVVNNEQLFSEFRMSKELKQKGERLVKMQKARLDSLNVQFALAEGEAQKQQVYDMILQEKDKMLQFNEAYSSEETAKIWKRIEGYVKDYAKLRQYEVIIGSQMQGDVLYYDQKRDITSDLLNYINKRYEGFN